MLIIEKLTRGIKQNGSFSEIRATVLELPEKPGSYTFGEEGAKAIVCPKSKGIRQTGCRKVVIRGLMGDDRRRVAYFPPRAENVSMQQIGLGEFLRFSTCLSRAKE